MSDLNHTANVTNLSPAPQIQLRPVVDAPRSPLWRRLVITAIGFAALNLLFLPVTVATIASLPNPIASFLICFILGAIGAEPGLLTIAAVFGPGIAWRRHLVVAFVILLLGLSGLAGYLLTDAVLKFMGARMNWPFALLVPILFCACQLPLWFFRSLFCWRIAKEQQVVLEKVPRLSISGILTATAVIALALGAVRFGHYLFLQALPAGAVVETRHWWLLTGIWAAFVSTISFAVLPVFTVAILRMKSPLLGAVVAAAWSALLFEAAITITRTVSGGWPFSFSWHFPAAIATGFTVSLIVPLLIVRSHGYRLLWGKGP